MSKHLTHARRVIELIMSFYGMFFGFGLLILLAIGGEPLWWLNLSADMQSDMANGILVSGVVHAVGVRVNGNWRWSPALRLIGMVGHATIITLIATSAFSATYLTPYGLASGVLTYSFVSVMFWMLAIGAYGDLRRSLAIWRICRG